MKKFAQVVCILILIIPYFYVPKLQAETLGDLKRALQQKQEEYNKNKQNTANTQEQINQTNASIDRIKKDIQATYDDIAALNTEIEQLNTDIEKKDQEMKDIINFVQISNGESAYLEYAFGAKDFTDFIYRMAISEQLTKYNEELIKEFNEMIEQNKQKQKQIESKRVTLANQQRDLQEKLASLGKELEAFEDTGVTIEQDIKYQQEIIELYEDKGCKDNENIKTCGVSTLPPGTAMFRQLVTGYVTSEWGNRPGILAGWHEGIDVSNHQNHVNVYAVGNGMVAQIIPRHSCGGNMVIVHHNINGKHYTTVYAHLYDITVTKGQTVTMDTVVGHMGGGSDTPWDTCSFGAHSHLTVATGWYGIDYSNFTAMNYKYSINPRSVINYPSGYRQPFDGRYTKY